MSAISTAISGVMDATNRFDKAASRTVRDASSGDDLVSDFVQQIEARQALSANISVIKASNAMTGQLLDIKA